MNSFAALLDQLAYEPRRNAKIALIAAYFRQTPDPERGYALAALTGGLVFPLAKAGLIRQLIAERTDPVLFALSYDYVGDLSETVALLWPTTDKATNGPPPPTLSDVVTTLASAHKSALPGHLTQWLDDLDETGRWALLKLITGGLRIGVSARLAKTAVAALGALVPDDIEQVWHGLMPPYMALFLWAEGHGPKPASDDPVPFRPVMLAHALEEADFAKWDAADFMAEWKWDGIRIQASAGRGEDGKRQLRLYSRTGEDLSAAFPDLADVLPFDGTVDGELLVMREGRVQSFNVLQQRLNRKQVSAKLIAEFPAHIRVYDLLVDGTEDIRALPFEARRKRLEARLPKATPRLDLSPLIVFASWKELTTMRSDPALAGAGPDAEAIEGCMLKRRDSAYLPGRPKGLWYKWKRDPMLVDAVLMYAQRGHGKRSSFYSDFTFGVWRKGPEGEVLVPVGKAYFGFTDEELVQLDRYVRKHTNDRHGPVRVVTANAESGLVLEVAFEGINRSTRHKSGVAMRFPRISRIRWDKPSREADVLDVLEKLISEPIL
ncbi:MAG: cisplatin damage response ATP-dependent DNA ligase [Beijerinckiaceae bacterium]